MSKLDIIELIGCMLFMLIVFTGAWFLMAMTEWVFKANPILSTAAAFAALFYTVYYFGGKKHGNI